MTKSKKIAKFARMCSNEGHEEWMNYTPSQFDYYAKEIIAEMIDKFDYIEAMANDNWFKKMIRKIKYA
jgi:hypothetical protein